MLSIHQLETNQAIGFFSYEFLYGLATVCESIFPPRFHRDGVPCSTSIQTPHVHVIEPTRQCYFNSLVGLLLTLLIPITFTGEGLQ
jgi:hypothetical protein